MKKTLRRFTLAVPSGTEKTQIRTFIRATDGTEYPVDREIEVQKFEPKTIEVDCPSDKDAREWPNEDWALAQYPGAHMLGTQDLVSIIPDE